MRADLNSLSRNDIKRSIFLLCREFVTKSCCVLFCHEQIFTNKYCKFKECETRNKPFLYISFCGAELKLGNYHQLISMFVYLKFGNVLG